MADGCLLNKKGGYKLLEKYELFMRKSARENEANSFFLIIPQSWDLKLGWTGKAKPNPNVEFYTLFPVILTLYLFFLFKMVRQCRQDVDGI